MKKSIFAVCDLDASYACNLMDYLNERRTTPFEVQAFTNISSLESFARENEIEILFMDKSGKPVGRVWIPKYGSISTIRKGQLN